MTTKDKVARRKLSLLELARSSTCQSGVQGNGLLTTAVLRDPAQLPDLRRRGPAGPSSRTRGPHPNRVAAEVEEAILAHAMEHPCHGALRVSQELRLEGIEVSSGGRSRGVAAPRFADQARAAASPGEGHDRAPGPSSARSRSGSWSDSLRSSANATSRPRIPAHWSQ